jgi:hypothetical protein
LLSSEKGPLDGGMPKKYLNIAHIGWRQGLDVAIEVRFQLKKWRFLVNIKYWEIESLIKLLS